MSLSTITLYKVTLSRIVWLVTIELDLQDKQYTISSTTRALTGPTKSTSVITDDCVFPGKTLQQSGIKRYTSIINDYLRDGWMDVNKVCKGKLDRELLINSYPNIIFDKNKQPLPMAGKLSNYCATRLYENDWICQQTFGAEHEIIKSPIALEGKGPTYLECEKIGDTVKVFDFVSKLNGKDRMELLKTTTLPEGYERVDYRILSGYYAIDNYYCKTHSKILYLRAANRPYAPGSTSSHDLIIFNPNN